LSPADLKLVKKLSELAARKRERIEHMKAFRKMKESKLPSLSSNLIALVISIFFLVIILQGMLVNYWLQSWYIFFPCAAGPHLDNMLHSTLSYPISLFRLLLQVYYLEITMTENSRVLQHRPLQVRV